MNRWQGVAVSFGIIFVLTCGAMASAQAVRATVSGTIKDSSGGVLPGATVNVTNTETSAVRSAVADHAGHYQMQGLASGKYQIVAELAGFRTAKVDGIQLVVGQEAKIDITLEVGEQAETITVVSEAPLIETRNAEVGGFVSAGQIRELPLNGRSFTELALLQPGAVNSTTSMRGSGVFGGKGVKIAVNGANIWSNLWLLDGNLINDSYNKTPGSIAGVLLGVDTVREFKTYTSTYGAELGGMGGVIDAVTKSGTNALQGNAFTFIRDSGLDARNFFDQAGPPPFTRRQFGATLGGPLLHDRTFFFAGFEGLRERLSRTQIYTVPDEQARLGILGNLRDPANPIRVPVSPGVVPYLALYPVPNGRNLGDGRAERIDVVNEPTDEYYGSLRIDHSFSGSDTLFGRVTVDKGDDLVSNASRLATFPEAERSNNRYLTIEQGHVFSERMLNRFRVGLNRTELSSANAPTTALPDSQFLPGRSFLNASLAITGLTALGGNTIEPVLQVQKLLEIADDVTYVRGAHTLKFGANFRRYNWDTDQDYHDGGTWSFADLRSFLTAQAVNFQIKMPGSTTDRYFRQMTIAGYVQDEIQVSERLTLNMGLRYELTTLPTERENRLAHLTDELHQTPDDFVIGQFWATNAATKNFGPRLGFAWDVRGDGKTSVRGGAGVYQEPVLEDKYDTWRLTSPFYYYGAINAPSFPNAFAGNASVPARVRDFVGPIKSPTMYRYSLLVDQQLTPTLAMSVGYIGAQGRQLWRAGEVNFPTPRTLPNGRLFFPPNTPRQNPAFDSISLRSTDGTSAYNSFQASALYRRLGGQAQISYTWAKSIDEASAIHGNDSITETSGLQFYPDRADSRGLSGFDVRHSFRANFTYPIPAHRDGVAGVLLNDWQVGAIVALASGSPFYLRAPSAGRTFLFSALRVDLKPGGNDNPVLGGPEKYYDATQFAMPVPGTLGNVRRNTIIGPGLQDVSLSLIKRFQFAQTRSVEFRAEAFNALNHANFAPPPYNAFDTSGNVLADAGRIRRTVTPARQIQFGLKVNF